MNKKYETDYERSDISPTVIGGIATGLGVFVLCVPLLLPLAFPISTYRAPPVTRPPVKAGTPPLLVNPSRELAQQAFKEEEDARSYGWEDREHNIVRIPVQRAVRQLLRTGIPGWTSQ